MDVVTVRKFLEAKLSELTLKTMLSLAGMSGADVL